MRGLGGGVLQLYLGAPECYSSAGLEESFPVKAVQFSFGPVCSDSREVVIAKMSHCATSLTRDLLVRRILGVGVKWLPPVRSSSKLNRVQSLYRISWGQGEAFQGGLGLLGFGGLILRQTQGSVGFCAQDLSDWWDSTV